MATISSSFAGDSVIGAQVTYTCSGALRTALGQQLQTASCTESGWTGEVLPCDGESRGEGQPPDAPLLR